MTLETRPGPQRQGSQLNRGNGLESATGQDTGDAGRLNLLTASQEQEPVSKQVNKLAQSGANLTSGGYFVSRLAEQETALAKQTAADPVKALSPATRKEFLAARTDLEAKLGPAVGRVKEQLTQLKLAHPGTIYEYQAPAITGPRSRDEKYFRVKPGATLPAPIQEAMNTKEALNQARLTLARTAGNGLGISKSPQQLEAAMHLNNPYLVRSGLANEAGRMELAAMKVQRELHSELGKAGQNVSRKVLTATAAFGTAFAANKLVDKALFHDSSPGFFTYAADIASPAVLLSGRSWPFKVGVMTVSHALGKGTDLASVRRNTNKS